MVSDEGREGRYTNDSEGDDGFVALKEKTKKSPIRLINAATGKMLNKFTGHTNESYGCCFCFGHGEATVTKKDRFGLGT